MCLAGPGGPLRRPNNKKKTTEAEKPAILRSIFEDSNSQDDSEPSINTRYIQSRVDLRRRQRVLSLTSLQSIYLTHQMDKAI